MKVKFRVKIELELDFGVGTERLEVPRMEDERVSESDGKMTDRRQSRLLPRLVHWVQRWPTTDRHPAASLSQPTIKERAVPVAKSATRHSTVLHGSLENGVKLRQVTVWNEVRDMR